MYSYLLRTLADNGHRLKIVRLQSNLNPAQLIARLSFGIVGKFPNTIKRIAKKFYIFTPFRLSHPISFSPAEIITPPAAFPSGRAMINPAFAHS